MKEYWRLNIYPHDPPAFRHWYDREYLPSKPPKRKPGVNKWAWARRCQPFPIILLNTRLKYGWNSADWFTEIK